MGQYTLNDLESLTGINSDTIRIWEKRYGILKPILSPTRRRLYNDEDLMRLINISILYRHGTKISSIASKTDSEIREKAAILSASEGTSGDMIGMMTIAMNRLDEIAVNEVLLKSVIERGFDSTITSVVFPFLRKVGVMWHTGAVNAGTEHFISSIFRQRLIAAIDALPPPKKDKGSRFLLFLPEGEMHELGLLFYTYLIKKRGNHVLYLGQSTPLKSVFSVTGLWSPDIVVTGSMTYLNLMGHEDFLRDLSMGLPGKKIFATGLMANIAKHIRIPDVIAIFDEKNLLRNIP